MPASQPLPQTHPDPLRVLQAAHRGAARYSKRARAEVTAAAREVLAYADADGIDLRPTEVRAAVAWVLLVAGAAPDRDAALAILVELVAHQLDTEVTP
jgi:hypothetical protein